MKIVTVRYGIGYGEHDLDLDVEDDATEEEIEEYAVDVVRERLWWSVDKDIEE